MADQNASNTERVRWIKSTRYVLNRVDGFTMDRTDAGTVLLNFFVSYPAVEAEYEFERDDQGNPVNPRGGRNMDEIMEFQQGALLDLASAEELRNELNELLRAENPAPGRSKKSEHASS